MKLAPIVLLLFLATVAVFAVIKVTAGFDQLKREVGGGLLNTAK